MTQEPQALATLGTLSDGWRGRWEVDAFDALVLHYRDDATELDDMDSDAKVELTALLNAIAPAVAAARAEIDRLRRLGLEACDLIADTTVDNYPATASRAAEIRKEVTRV